MAPPCDAQLEEDDGFQLVGCKGRALPRRARRNLAVKEAAAAPAALPPREPKEGPTDQPARSLQPRRPPWLHAQRPCLSVAPMMQWTDAHFRSFARLLTRRTLLFTEMVPAVAIVDAERDGSLAKLLAFEAAHRPMAVQIGGNSPATMARAARLCAEAGFDEVNLNVGCPSAKVTTGGYGACLMKKPELVREIADAVVQACSGRDGVAITVKHRLGVDDCDSWEELEAFVRKVASSGVTHFIVHARKALLGLLSCEGNRTIPPLKYNWVRSLVETFPGLTFELNGGVQSLMEVSQLIAEASFEGVMVGRAAYKTPWPLLSCADSSVFGSEDIGHSRQEVLDLYLDYAAGFFHSQQRAGQVSTSSAALEVEQALAAPVSYLFEDQTPVFRAVLLQEVAARETEDAAACRRSSSWLPPFLLRRAAAAALEATLKTPIACE
mmetsp:Transcript_103938/g.323984  ORF Transcript_103938/g.323984 Transcript_103938/m.323984 type:complete len:438 (+) Transcript_103938:73-1386(+)